MDIKWISSKMLRIGNPVQLLHVSRPTSWPILPRRTRESRKICCYLSETSLLVVKRIIFLCSYIKDIMSIADVHAENSKLWKITWQEVVEKLWMPSQSFAGFFTDTRTKLTQILEGNLR